MPLRSLLLLLPLAAGPAFALPGGNILLVVADDVGVYELASYGEGTDPAVTPTIDGLAASGVLFRNCWSEPLCSPTRATLMTGRYAVQTGIGTLVSAEWDLRLDELTVAASLRTAPDPYRTGFFGKWHLTNLALGGPTAPNLLGFDDAVWTVGNLVAPQNSYTHWTEIENGVEVEHDGYVTTHTVDDALQFVATAPEPWFLVLSFNAAHAPYHAPPRALYTSDISQATSAYQRPLYKAMIESLDHELGRFLDTLDASGTRANVIFLGDNGSPTGVIGPPGQDGKAKGTPYEGGVNVPLIVSGPAVTQPGAECSALVNTTDVFATIVELGGQTIPTETVAHLQIRSVSIVPYLSKPLAPSLRETVYTEYFKPTGFAATQYKGAVREERYKLLVYLAPIQVQLFDLWSDPSESSNLLVAPLTPSARAAFDVLSDEFVAKVLSYGQ